MTPLIRFDPTGWGPRRCPRCGRDRDEPHPWFCNAFFCDRDWFGP